MFAPVFAGVVNVAGVISLAIAVKAVARKPKRNKDNFFILGGGFSYKFCFLRVLIFQTYKKSYQTKKSFLIKLGVNTKKRRKLQLKHYADATNQKLFPFFLTKKNGLRCSNL